MAPGSPPSVCVIDDDPAVRTALGRLIRSAGFGVCLHESAEAFLAASAEAPACLVLDVGLPGMSGLALLASDAVANRRYPVIVISGIGDDEMRRKAKSLGAVAFLNKPLAGESLLEAIDAALSTGAHGVESRGDS